MFLVFSPVVIITAFVVFANSSLGNKVAYAQSSPKVILFCFNIPQDLQGSSSDKELQLHFKVASFIFWFIGVTLHLLHGGVST